jgi:hypothetical protein
MTDTFMMLSLIAHALVLGALGCTIILLVRFNRRLYALCRHLTDITHNEGYIG